MWWADHWPMPGMFFGPLIGLVVMVVCMTMMFFMMRGRMTHRHGGGHAIGILKERFARGEINRAEFEEQRRVLGG